MRNSVLAAMLAAVTLTAVPAGAQYAPRDPHGDYREDRRDDRREDRREMRRDRRETVRDWRQYRNYDYNRNEPGQRTYYADRYYRDGAGYRPYQLGRTDRVYRGSNGRYYCRRSDGTTGLIVGAAAGSLFGNVIAPGGSKLLGTLLGGTAGAVIGNSADRGVSCR